MGHYPKSVLIIEDDKDQAFLIRKTLERWTEKKSVSFDIAHSVDDALKKLDATKFELILTDYKLPGKSGFEMLEEVKKRKLVCPLILMTAAGDEQLVRKALRAGFFDYLAKTDEYIRLIPKAIEETYHRFVLKQKEQTKQDELRRKNRELTNKNKKLSELSVLDDLTGLCNHRFLQEKFTEEFARASRYHYPFSCLMIDIDHFKVINDTHGHQAGDVVLKELAEFFKSHLRQADTIARYGGEEFCILLPHATYEGAQTLAERLRNKVMGNTFATSLNVAARISISIGISSYPEDPIDQKDTMLFYADKALYRAKSSGRNRTCLYQTVTKEYAKKIPNIQVKDDQVLELRQRLLDISEMAKRAYIEATKALINALESKDRQTLGHAARVARISDAIAKAMGFNEEDCRIFEHAGLLHDIGKICVKDHILLKSSHFDKKEYEEMQHHPALGYQIVKPIKFLADEATIILHHHEWFDGHGYPNKLKGKEIPVGARVVAVADAYDTMRVAGARYKATKTCSEAVRELVDYSGTQFDPEVVRQLIQVLVRKGDMAPDDYDQKKLDLALKQKAA